MQNFTYRVPTKAVFGKDTIDQVGTLIPSDAKVLLLFGGGSIKKNGVYDRVAKQVKFVAEFGGIEANPEHETCLRAMDLVRKSGATFILAVGGGSVVDACKYIAAGAKWTKTPNPYDFVERWGLSAADPEYEPKESVPFGCVLTLPATGTEMNSGAVISWRAMQKKIGFGHPGVFPVFSVLDPVTTYSLPKKQVANGLADGFVHVAEQYMPHFGIARVQDGQSEAVMRAIVEVTPEALQDSPCIYSARADFFWATTQALNGLVGLGVPQCWATHRIGHELTAFYGLDHGLTLAIIMPQVMRFLKEQRKKKLEQMAVRVFGVSGAVDMADQAILHCEKWFQSLGLKTTLSGNGCDDRHFAAIAKKFESVQLGPEKLIGPEEVLKILKMAL